MGWVIFLQVKTFSMIQLFEIFDVNGLNTEYQLFVLCDHLGDHPDNNTKQTTFSLANLVILSIFELDKYFKKSSYCWKGPLGMTKANVYMEGSSLINTQGKSEEMLGNW